MAACVLGVEERKRGKLQQIERRGLEPASGTFLLASIATKLCKKDRHFQPIASKTRILVLSIVAAVMGALRMSLPSLASPLVNRMSSLGIELN